MKINHPLTIAFSFLCLSFSKPSGAQNFTDTLYYDQTWSICEKPIASYYRLCTLAHDATTVHFTGAFKDYTINDLLFLEGNYDAEGRKNGLFTFYYPNGRIRKKGNFIASEMNGFWYYYQYDGTLYFVNNLFNNREAAPVFILNNNYDTVLQQGNGSFNLVTTDYPDVYGKLPVIIDGNCSNGFKTGVWHYTEGQENYDAGNEEYDAKGKLIATHWKVSMRANEPYHYINYLPVEVAATDEFFISAAFKYGNNKPGNKNVIDYLVQGTKPMLVVNSSGYSDNLNYFANIFREAITPGYTNLLLRDKKPPQSEQKVLTLFDPESLYQNTSKFLYDHERVPSESFMNAIDADVYDSLTSPTTLKLTCRFLINNDGTVSNIKVNGNMPQKTMQAMAYYLSIFKGLKPNAKHQYTQLYYYANKTKVQSVKSVVFYVSYYDRSAMYSSTAKAN